MQQLKINHHQTPKEPFASVPELASTTVLLATAIKRNKRRSYPDSGMVSEGVSRLKASTPVKVSDRFEVMLRRLALGKVAEI